LENKIINIGIVAEVAEALGELKKDIVFVGGAVVSLYTDDPAADEIRPTKDIDMTLNIVNLNHWQQINEKLASLGFHPDPYGHAICSFKYKDIPVDIMAAEDGPLGSANRWYKIGFKNLWTVMAKQQEIQLLTAPCYLATKFEAFNDRGSDYRTSHDIEDIIYIIDNRIGIVDEISKAEVDISNFIRQQFNEIIQQEMLKEVLISHIHPIMLEERMSIVEDKIIKILQN
jgi:predicted nucleotidyltransferase